ncbi:TadA family conjugal transfer-associated ATPase [Acaricomes phytoseiuli]|uniref:TadA family conjugal transfer-associated ATPase n=1 Tax=Acaricomes phytoseiuli TaxID=291968 RepID=UPI000370D70A|nr:TadA family conjugal transfer-associated ATPase [Acaricomes phytoseiuli]MCW1249684.1 TadA family conjugal transfer-associated ATPase [Acaricomes phytoseiuli]
MSGLEANGGSSSGLTADPRLISSVREEILTSAQPVTRSSVISALRARGGILAASGAMGAAERIYAELGGLGPLQTVLDDSAVTDIYVNFPAEVWIDRGQGVERAPLSFDDEQHLRAFAIRLMARAGKSVDETTPCLDARLPGGIRVHAVLPPISPAGTLLSLRIKRSRPIAVDEFLAAGATIPGGSDSPTEVEELLRAMMASHCNFLISGATGTGKTTLLSTLLSMCGAQERLILVEDTGELDPEHRHIIRLESRPSNLEGQGSLGLDRLIFEALRMNPDRLIVGECRGSEIRELFTALNTGHSGGGTIHANSVRDVPARLSALGALAGWDTTTVMAQAVSAIDLLLHVGRHGSHRMLRQIAVLGRSGGELYAEPALEWDGRSWSRGPGWAGLLQKIQRVLH